MSYSDELLKNFLEGRANIVPSEVVKELLQIRDRCAEHDRRLETANACDVCTGTGKPVSGKPCICGGTGQSGHEKAGLRKRVLDLELQVYALSGLLEEIRDAMMNGALLNGSHARPDFFISKIETSQKSERRVESCACGCHAYATRDGVPISCSCCSAARVPEKKVRSCSVCGKPAMDGDQLLSARCSGCYAQLVAGLEKRIEARPLEGCGVCGGKLATIRGAFPKDPDRVICPTCAQERWEDHLSAQQPPSQAKQS